MSSEDGSVVTNVTTEPSSLDPLEAFAKRFSSLRDLVAQSSSQGCWVAI